jgi:uncharacterized protein YjbI with pentapeptide repeats
LPISTAEATGAAWLAAGGSPLLAVGWFAILVVNAVLAEFVYPWNRRERRGDRTERLYRLWQGTWDGDGPDLAGAWLRDAGLAGAPFAGARAEGAVLRGARLTGATLTAADLRRADLRQASLAGADLRRADLFEARLQGADLRAADLRGADLTGAGLEGAAYDEQTRWPDGFEPKTSGALLRPADAPSGGGAPWTSRPS